MEITLAGSLVAVVGVSRVWLQVHFPSDVVVGAAAATLLVLALHHAPPWQAGRP